MIRLFALDVDGTLTDGGFFMDGKGSEYKRFDVKDGYGLLALSRSGVEVAIISGRFSAATQKRATDLGIKHVVNGVADKLPVLQEMAENFGIVKEEIAFMGDDVQDISCIEWAGMGMAVADAHIKVIETADWVSNIRGGFGAVREACDYIMKINGENAKI